MGYLNTSPDRDTWVGNPVEVTRNDSPTGGTWVLDLDEVTCVRGPGGDTYVRGLDRWTIGPLIQSIGILWSSFERVPGVVNRMGLRNLSD